MNSDSTMPVKFQPPHFGSNPLEATRPEAALTYMVKLTSILQAPDSSPYSQAMLSRVLANELTDLTGYCFRKLDVSPWGDDERAELAAEMDAARAKS